MNPTSDTFDIDATNVARRPMGGPDLPWSRCRVITLTVEESNAAYFDSVLTVRRNLELIERVLGELG